MNIQLDPLKAHVFQTDNKRIAVHTEHEIGLGSHVTLAGITWPVKDVTRSQHSSYWPNHLYYELKV